MNSDKPIYNLVDGKGRVLIPKELCTNVDKLIETRIDRHFLGFA